MYKIRIPDGRVYKTEFITYIKYYSQNAFLVCEKEKAEGIVFNGEHYFFRDGLKVQEYDSYQEVKDLNDKIREQNDFFNDMAQAYIEGVNSIDE